MIYFLILFIIYVIGFISILLLFVLDKNYDTKSPNLKSNFQWGFMIGIVWPVLAYEFIKETIRELAIYFKKGK